MSKKFDKILESSMNLWIEQVVLQREAIKLLAEKSNPSLETIKYALENNVDNLAKLISPRNKNIQSMIKDEFKIFLLNGESLVKTFINQGARARRLGLAKMKISSNRIASIFFSINKIYSEKEWFTMINGLLLLTGEEIFKIRQKQLAMNTFDRILELAIKIAVKFTNLVHPQRIHFSTEMTYPLQQAILLWMQHIIWTKETVEYAYKGEKKHVDQTVQRLMKNQEDLGNYLNMDNESTQKIIKLLKEHIQQAYNIVSFLLQKKDKEAGEETSRWFQNAI